jgi:hypothetical protein
MNEWIGLIFDAILIVVVGAGVVQAIRLIRQLQDLRAGRVEMERFVRDFNGAVIRAEAGIKGLRSAARDSGDDLEKLVEKALLIRDELNFIVESADGVAERLSVAASTVLNSERSQRPKPQDDRAQEAAKPSAPAAQGQQQATGSSGQAPAGAKQDQPASRAEKELLQALQKLS